MAKRKIFYYHDELNDDFAGTNIQTKSVPNDYPFIQKGFIFRFFSFWLYYLIAKPIVWILMKIIYGTKLKNRQVLKHVKKTGYFIYANHTGDMLDAFRPNTLTFTKRNYIIANPDAFSIRGIKTIVQMLGGLPMVENNLKLQINLLKAIETRIKQKASVTIYPEQHIWPYYTKIRPYTSAAFHYPVMLNAPVIVVTTTYQKHRGLFKWMKRPKAVQYLDGPFYPDTSLSKIDAKQLLRDQVYQTMVKRATAFPQYEYHQYIKQERT